MVDSFPKDRGDFRGPDGGTEYHSGVGGSVRGSVSE